MSDWAWWVVWGFAAVLVYSLGFVATVAMKARTCDRQVHTECDHVWGDPVVPLWFVWVALAVALAPIWVPLVLCTKVSKRVDQRIVENRRSRTEPMNG